MTLSVTPQHYYVYLMAAYLLEERTEAEEAVLHDKFSKPGTKRRFDSLWKYMDAEQNRSGKSAVHSDTN
jgi:hypothetical protein